MALPLRRFQCSGCSVQVYHFLNLKPETLNIWCLEFDLLQRSTTPLLQLSLDSLLLSNSHLNPVLYLIQRRCCHLVTHFHPVQDLHHGV
jgi:hypothetical protein